MTIILELLSTVPLTFFLIILGYLFGSVTSAIIVARLMNLPDPRTQGSGNPGSTNMLRLGNRSAAFFTLLGDILKGFIPVILARTLNVSAFDQGLIAIAAFLGHLYPIFFRFQGGKGVATALGVLIALAPSLAFSAASTWIIIFITTRISSLAALAATICTPIYAWWFVQLPIFYAVLVMAFFLIWRHRSNISNLFTRREMKF